MSIDLLDRVVENAGLLFRTTQSGTGGPRIVPEVGDVTSVVEMQTCVLIAWPWLESSDKLVSTLFSYRAPFGTPDRKERKKNTEGFSFVWNQRELPH